jgi:FkbM family methyltransferase
LTRGLAVEAKSLPESTLFYPTPTMYSHTPFRQLARFYGSVLRGSSALSDLANTIAASEQRRQQEAHAQARQTVEALSNSVREMGERIASTVQALPGRVDNPKVNLYHRLGLNLVLDRSSVVDRGLIDDGHWEPRQVEFLTRIMRRQLAIEPITFLDLGSYWGLYSLLAMRAGVQTVHAFEADRHNYSQLQAQLFLNDAVGVVTTHFKAVSDKNGSVQFWDSRTHPDGNRGGVGIIGKPDGRPCFDMPCVKVDDHLPLQGKFLVIKMDLEGHEAYALRGMRETFKNNRAVMQVEIFDQHEAASQPILKELGLKRFHRIDHDSYYANFDAGYLLS